MAKRKGEGPYFNNSSKDPIRHDRSVDQSGNPLGKRQLDYGRIQQDGIVPNTDGLVGSGSGKLPKD